MYVLVTLGTLKTIYFFRKHQIPPYAYATVGMRDLEQKILA